MSKGNLDSESRLRQPDGWYLSSSSFFELYSKVPAFIRRSGKPNGAIRLFDDAKSLLETKLDSRSKKSASSAKGGFQYVSNVHALLALVYWLYPDHSGYDRQKIIAMMLKHSTAAMAKSESKFSPSYALGLFVQLRVLSFLVRSKKVDPEEIARRRHDAKGLLDLFSLGSKSSIGYSEYSKHEDSELFKGIIYDALAFSHYQLERDNQVALNLLDASVKSFDEVNKFLHQKGLSQRNTLLSKIKRSFCDSFAAVARWDYGLCYESLAENLEGEEKLSFSKLARSQYERSYQFARRTSWEIYKGLSAYSIAGAYVSESETVSDRRTIRALLKKSVSVGEEALKWMACWSTYESDFLGGSMIAGFYQRLAEYSSASERRIYINRSLELARKAIDLLEKPRSKSARYSQVQIGDIFYGNANYYRQTAMEQRVSLSSVGIPQRQEVKRIIEPLNSALEYCLKSKSFYTEERHRKRSVEACLLAGEVCYELMNCNIIDSERKRLASIAKRQCKEVVSISERMRWDDRVGESNWLGAQVFDREGDYEASSASYIRAYEAYQEAGNASANARRVFGDFGYYMLALSKIELAKTFHRKSNFQSASARYSEASKLISQSKRWRERSSLFLAESLIEKAENESLADNPQTSIDLFDEAILELTKFLNVNRRSAAEDSAEFRFGSQLVAFCRARVILEKSKESYKTGDIEQSVKRLSSAEAMFQELSSSPTSDSIRANELDSMASLCGALKRFQNAQITSNPSLYLEAREIFGTAAKTSRSKSLRLLLSGLAGFASFLYYSSEIERSLETSFSVDKLIACNRALESSGSIFRRLGNKSFLNMLKASKHILDATIKMSAAEREVERTQEKAKLYSQAQRSLSLASKYYRMVGSSKRVRESIKMISAVRNHQRLIPLAHDIIAEVASNQIIYSAIANSSLVDQSRFDSSRVLETAYVALECEIDKAYVNSGEVCTLTVTISNLGRDPISVLKIDEILPEEFELDSSLYPVAGEHSIKLNLRVDQGAMRQISLRYKSNSVGSFVWHPSLVYIDSTKNYRIVRAQSVRSVVERSVTIDFSSLLVEKKRLESELTELKKKKELVTSGEIESSRFEDQLYSLKEQISKIDEEFLRTKNEYVSMQQDLDRLKSDLTALNATRSSANPQDKTDLEAEEKLLIAKIERRRSLLERAQLL